MRKIISLFKRDYDGDRLVYDEVVPGAEWVSADEGEPTRKWDGTCTMVRDGALFKRYTLKKGRTAPPDFDATTEPDPNTGKQEGWIAVGPGPEDQYHRSALDVGLPVDGTYELVGPKVQGGMEGFRLHFLIPHGEWILRDAPRDFEGLKKYLDRGGIEGIVWHHPDGRMVKIKARDFGVSR